MMIVGRLALGAGALLALAGCGRVGPIRAPGPASEIVYPRPYPYLPRDAAATRDASQGVAPSTSGLSSPPESLPVARPASPR